MKCTKCDLSSDLKNLQIEIFSDLHIGSRKCDYKLIKERVEKVKNDPNRYAIILGDLCNNSTRNSVGDVYEEALTPMQQIEVVVKTFEPIKDKILGVTSGNHERRTYKSDGIDILHVVCNQLGISDKYDSTAMLLFIRLGQCHDKKERKIVYTLYMTHGDGQGGRTIGGKANGLQRRGDIVNADIVVTGHTHAPFTFRDAFYEVNYTNSKVVLKEQVFVNASATLDYEGYAELYGMKPSSKTSPVIILNGRNKSVTTSI